MEVQAALDELIECGKQFVEDRRADVETALQADKEAREKIDRSVEGGKCAIRGLMETRVDTTEGTR